MIQQKKKFIVEYHVQHAGKSQDTKSIEGRSLSGQVKENTRWISPPMHTWPLNSDASWSEAQQIAGLGWILRDWKGEIILAGNKMVTNCGSIKKLEAGAVL